MDLTVLLSTSSISMCLESSVDVSRARDHVQNFLYSCSISHFSTQSFHVSWVTLICSYFISARFFVTISFLHDFFFFPKWYCVFLLTFGDILPPRASFVVSMTVCRRYMSFSNESSSIQLLVYLLYFEILMLCLWFFFVLSVETCRCEVWFEIRLSWFNRRVNRRYYIHRSYSFIFSMDVSAIVFLSISFSKILITSLRLEFWIRKYFDENRVQTSD